MTPDLMLHASGANGNPFAAPSRFFDAVDVIISDDLGP